MKVSKILVSALTLCALAGTTIPALANTTRVGTIEDYSTTVYSGGGVGATISCYSQVLNKYTSIELRSSAVETNLGILDKSVRVSGMNVYFSGTVSWGKYKDSWSSTHYY